MKNEVVIISKQYFVEYLFCKSFFLLFQFSTLKKEVTSEITLFSANWTTFITGEAEAQTDFRKLRHRLNKRHYASIKWITGNEEEIVKGHIQFLWSNCPSTSYILGCFYNQAEYSKELPLSSLSCYTLSHNKDWELVVKYTVLYTVKQVSLHR